MAFMVPLVKNHYDIYARNNPADHHNNGNNGGTNNTGITGKSGNLVHDPASNSLILSATSLGKSGAPVKKQYRIILSGGQVVTNGNNGGKKKVPGGAGANFVTANGKAYYRMPSASISLPVNGRGPRPGGPGGAPRRSSKSTSEAGGAGSVRSTPTSPEHRSNSSNGSNSPGSPPHYPSSRPPHSASASICQQPTSGSFRRTSAGVRSPQNNRLYSYSVSIPEDEEKKVKESLNSLLADKENLVDQESQLEDDHQLLAIFATSAPGGTGALEEASLVKPPPSLKMMKKKMAKKPLVQKSASLNAASPPPLVETKVHSISPSSPPASPTSSPPASPSPSPSPSPPPPITTTSREYVELLRKFILHLKMLKIGSSSNNNNNGSSKQRKQSKKSSVKSIKSNGVDKEESELSAAAAADDSVVDAAVEVGSSEVSSEDSTSAPKRARKRKDTMEDSKDL
ncbi:PREDICTED: ras guanine nucleotide exchange factor Y-like [Rhagoletis zephyria]|uniref:ras guanine nucleotide exchange factor Y-like n=1 Tax=Rhagoletis zephyria TaxID=28612 RepID=UPI0008116F75|nr:PREDICTED: ras guanine nucleotide exchange factor Y-like [Rhagoletis zephyria]